MGSIGLNFTKIGMVEVVDNVIIQSTILVSIFYGFQIYRGQNFHFP